MLYDLPSVMKKLIGEVVPVGETDEDNKRYENLKELESVVDSTFKSLFDVYMYRDCPEFSRQRAGEKAYKILTNLRDVLVDEFGYPEE